MVSHNCLRIILLCGISINSSPLSSYHPKVKLNTTVDNKQVPRALEVQLSQQYLNSTAARVLIFKTKSSITPTRSRCPCFQIKPSPTRYLIAEEGNKSELGNHFMKRCLFLLLLLRKKSITVLKIKAQQIHS